MEAILDLFATNKPGLVKSINNGPGISYDHDIIIIDSDVRARTTKKSPHKIYKWAKADWDNIKADTSAFADRYQGTKALRRPQELQWNKLDGGINEILQTGLEEGNSKTFWKYVRS